MAVFQYLFSVSTLKSTNQRNCLKNVFYGIDHQSIKFYLFVHSWQIIFFGEDLILKLFMTYLYSATKKTPLIRF